MEMEPHLRETLRRLRLRYRTAIATNRGVSMPYVMKDHGLEEFFDLTVTSLDVAEPKPHPECLQRVIHHFRIAPNEALYVGDADTDRRVAEAAGVPFVAYKNPGLPARHHIEDHLEILDVIEERSGEGEGG
jgi:HAD superfamily hydrolase (TIGR01509 family)